MKHFLNLLISEEPFFWNLIVSLSVILVFLVLLLIFAAPHMDSRPDSWNILPLEIQSPSTDAYQQEEHITFLPIKMRLLDEIENESGN